ncbi:MAG: HAMP domain-containing protein, partial [Opitutaceae bacterium]|nr:HAMP domain-containing protein [Opitutaceae bacterium]
AAERKEFAPVATALDLIDREAQQRANGASDHSIHALAQTLRNRINDLSEIEARRIATGLLTPAQPGGEARSVELEQDVILRERSQMLIYEMPSTHWRVALAMPARQTQAVINDMIERVAAFLLVVSLTVCLVVWLYFKLIFLRPLNNLTRRLREIAAHRDLQARLPVHGRDELARLAYWFNARTDMLKQAYTELKHQSSVIDEARMTAVRADRSKNIFLASMSHELRTPLNAIIGMSAFLQGTRLDDEQADYARTIHSSSNALLDLVNDIMDFSKIEAGQLELERADFDLRIILDEVSDMLAYTAAERASDSSACSIPPAKAGSRATPAVSVRSLPISPRMP